MKNVTAAAYQTLQIMNLAPANAEYNQRRNTWTFNATDAEYQEMLVALRSDEARAIGEQILASR